MVIFIQDDLEMLIEGMVLELSYEDKCFVIMQADQRKVLNVKMSSENRGKNM